MLDPAEYKLIVDSSPNMIWRSGLDAACYYFNPTWLVFTGRRMEDEVGEGWVQGVHPDDLDSCVDYYLRHFRQREPFEMNYRLRRHDGQYRWINDRGIPVYGDDGEFNGYIGSCMDITEKVEGQAIRQMAEHDAVCGVYNRPTAYRLLDALLHGGAYLLTLIMIDIDEFKQINDRFGHLSGDAALRHVATVLQRSLRSHDVLGRFGGDEFFIGLPDTSVTGGVEAAERIRATLAEHPLVLADGSERYLTLSIGVYASRTGDSLDDLIQRADTAMYRAKESGRDRVCTFA